MDERLENEIELLRSWWPDLKFKNRWVLLPAYSAPDPIVQDDVAICFQVKDGHPREAPYGFFVREPIEPAKGGDFNNVTRSNNPPFEGTWLKFSWKPADWKPGASVQSGANLANWAQSFHERLEEGQ